MGGMEREGSGSEQWVAAPVDSAPNLKCQCFNFPALMHLRLMYRVSFPKDFRRERLLSQEQLTKPEAMSVLLGRR